MRILFLSNWFPYPFNNGSKLRVYNLLRGLAQQHEVTLVSFTDRRGNTIPSQLARLCRKIYVTPERPYNSRSVRALLGFLSARPRVLVDRYQPEMAHLVAREVMSGRYDLVVASQWYMAAYLEGLGDIPAIFEEAEVGIFEDKKLRAPTPAHRLRSELTQRKMQAYLRRLAPRFGAFTVVSEGERALLRRMLPGYPVVEVIPNGVNLADYSEYCEPPQPETLIFTGSFGYGPNYEAMRWFVEEALPLVRLQVPGVKVTITGDPAGLTLPGVAQVGSVGDIRPLVAASWAALAPIQSGGGTRLKILEAMALRTPVVATHKGAEGLKVNNGEHLLLADSPQEFAAAVVRVLQDRELRERLAASAYQRIAERYNWPVILPRFLSLAERVAQQRRQPPGLAYPEFSRYE